ncbi:phospholipid ABC transporter ATP-binding protein MlaF [Shewanella oneidensis MR-1]|uniref:ABC-type phospholipid uptake (Salvage) system ATPase component MlaF n=1 Tax=Shewanella oneidensis (strain ATCC 700550 / JCM 31522 / CIP 106686 / LMG 19005 / NCIMB 14063 / MR-1) TaxID=211586 RepID=Q8EAF2_SHEON|nr:phospholipid ABC transporter ATP-binding protein MlaF [Shewanella oneidensis]AAN56928.1 ABC-type phospholipid uptake (salvage) system ATPase component MlaF [Shewanella oneidensis MR-1]MDX5998715.1 phospholipid ABC transporter ATP-binding protein MlaF [Shewanella oneidensis]MEE2028447.1 Intermembrane phospholipid transport system ATP-binding protein MlaF [Shewanella oneidensis]QKG98246.1 phospholipid ABC transporter ATP-binding protein MlaF [Shewanella oneidensis MR-1]
MTQEQTPLVEIRHLGFRRGQRVIYEDISLSIPRGKVTAIMGPSGIGKTTLLKLIGGQLTPDSGQVLFDGQDVHAASRNELFELRKRMSMLFQSGALFTDINVFDNVAFALREHSGLPEEIIRTIVLMKLEAVGLRGAAQLMPSELSGGMQRRAALARAIALEPEMVMYDEPFAGQDPISMGVLVKLIRELSDALNLTSVVVSHDVDEVLGIADYVYVVADKKVIAHGTPEELKHADNPQLKQFIEGAPDGPVPFHYPAKDYQQELLAKGVGK